MGRVGHGDRNLVPEKVGSGEWQRCMQFIADVYESEEESSAIAAGTTNQVIWAIHVSEAQ